MHDIVKTHEVAHEQAQERCAKAQEAEKGAQAAVVTTEARKKAAQAALQVAEAQDETARQIHATSASTALKALKEEKENEQSLLSARTQASACASALSGQQDLDLILFRDATEWLKLHPVRH